MRVSRSVFGPMVLLSALMLACSGSTDPVSAPSDPGPADTPSTPSQPLRGDNTYGADVNPRGNPIGGGAGYSAILTSYDVYVTTKEELLDGLARAAPGRVIYVADTVEVDLTGLIGIEIWGGVTLASGRGRDGSEGALIYATNLDAYPLFRVTGPGARMTGLRLRGPDQLRRTEQMKALSAEGRYYSIPNSDGIQTTQSKLEVDNCELYGWSHGAIYLQTGSIGNHIHHNTFHHNQRHGLGYGVVLNESDALIEANLFDYGRHHIAGTGRPLTSYEARYNIVLGNANSHSFDMHGGRDRGDGTDIAGGTILIHHNTFGAVDVAGVVIRGRPTDVCDVYNNWFLHDLPDAAAKQIYHFGNFRHYKNQYGKSRVVKD